MAMSPQDISSQLVRSAGDSAGNNNEEELEYSVRDEELGSEEERLEGDTQAPAQTSNQEVGQGDDLDNFRRKFYYLYLETLHVFR